MSHLSYILSYYTLFYDNYIYLSIISDASFPPETPPNGMATAEEPSPLPIHTLPPCLFNPFPFMINMHVLLHPILPSYIWPSFFPRSHSFTHTNTFFTNLHSSFSQYDQTTLKYLFSPIALHHTSLHLHKVPSHTFYTCFHYSHPPILSRHMLLHTMHSWLLCPIPCQSLIHTSVLAEVNNYLNNNLNKTYLK